MQRDYKAEIAGMEIKWIKAVGKNQFPRDGNGKKLRWSQSVDTLKAQLYDQVNGLADWRPAPSRAAGDEGG